MKKIIGVFAALMVALAMTGVAYACWSQTIFIEGTVETGYVCVGWSDVYTEDEWNVTKDVGEIDAWLEDQKGWHIDTPIYETLVVELSNVYPSYEAYIEVDISNGGTIPVDLVDFGLYPVSDPDELLRFVNWYINYVDWPGCPQIDPCQTVTVGVYIHIMQEIWDGEEWVTCPQDATATFAGYLTFNQWNE